MESNSLNVLGKQPFDKENELEYTIKYNTHFEKSMFEKTEQQTTIIGEGIKLEGEFSGKGDLELYGELKGNISITGRIKIGMNAVAVANIVASSAEIAGTVRGKVSIANSVDILSTGNINGDVKAQEITIAKGAAINGKVHIDVKNNISTTHQSLKGEKGKE